MSLPIAVTGMGAVTAAGLGVGPLWDAVKTGTSCIRAIPDAEFSSNHVRLAARSHFIIADHFPTLQERSLDRFAAMAAVAAREAAAQSGHRPEPWGDRTGVIIGTGIGGVATSQAMSAAFLDRRRGDPLSVPKIMPSAAASQIALEFGVHGTVLSISGACSSAAQAIGLGCQLIRSGVVDRVIAGGAESMIIPAAMQAWEMLRVLTPSMPRPFSLGRNGMVLGEGAGAVVLERMDLAERRDARVLARVLGYGTTSDAKDLLKSDPDRAAGAIGQAITDAGIDRKDIAYCNAHGTGTIANDIAEAQALRLVFGSALDVLPVSSTKPVHGHTIGASGAIEAIVTIMALREKLAPPTINWQGPDPLAPIDCVPNTPREIAGSIGMSNSFAFGGINCCLVFSADGS